MKATTLLEEGRPLRSLKIKEKRSVQTTQRHNSPQELSLELEEDPLRGAAAGAK